MNLKQLLATGASIAAFATCSIADVGDLPAKRTPAPAAEASTGGPVDRELELRVGPRISFLTGGARVGVAGTGFDIWDDLKLDSPNGGIQFDADWQPVSRWHVTYGMTWDRHDQSGVTGKAIRNSASPTDTLVAGSAVKTDLDIYSFEGTLGYDLFKNDSVRIKPYVGGKAYLIDGNVTLSNNGPGGTGLSRTSNSSRAEGTYLLGLDSRFYATQDWYLGGDIGGSAWSEYYNLTGDAYTGYDFNKNWGMRLGYAYDYIDYENKNKSFKAEPLLGAVYIQVVYGF